jgi:hypothetical protein
MKAESASGAKFATHARRRPAVCAAAILVAGALFAMSSAPAVAWAAPPVPMTLIQLDVLRDEGW